MYSPAQTLPELTRKQEEPGAEPEPSFWDRRDYAMQDLEEISKTFNLSRRRELLESVEREVAAMLELL